jgi:hypothetical protein
MISIDEVNARRADAIRRNRWNPEIIAILKRSIGALLREDRSAKEIGLTVNLSNSKVCRWAHVLGFRRMYVTADERAAIMQMRKDAP